MNIQIYFELQKIPNANIQIFSPAICEQTVNPISGIKTTSDVTKYDTKCNQSTTCKYIQFC